MRKDIPEGAIRTIQASLQNLGLYSGAIDGKRSPLGPNLLSTTDFAIDAALSARQNELTLKPSENNYQGWDDERKAVAYFQLLMKDAGQDVGPVDGYWNLQIDTAYDLHSGLLPADWRDKQDALSPINISHTNPNNWPAENNRSLSQFYGPPCTVPLTRVTVPWSMRLAWDQSTRIRTVSIHNKCASSLNRVFNEIANTYTAKELEDYGLGNYGGSYNCRRKIGGSTMSTHAWGIAIDFDPIRNQLSWGANRAFLARPELEPFWDIWENEGWVSLGRSKNFDWMHVQAAVIT